MTTGFLLPAFGGCDDAPNQRARPIARKLLVRGAQTRAGADQNRRCCIPRNSERTIAARGMNVAPLRRDRAAIAPAIAMMDRVGEAHRADCAAATSRLRGLRKKGVCNACLRRCVATGFCCASE